MYLTTHILFSHTHRMNSHSFIHSKNTHRFFTKIHQKQSVQKSWHILLIIHFLFIILQMSVFKIKSLRNHAAFGQLLIMRFTFIKKRKLRHLYLELEHIDNYLENRINEILKVIMCPDNNCWALNRKSSRLGRGILGR